MLAFIGALPLYSQALGPTFDLRPVIVPAMSIGGVPLATCSGIVSVAISETAEIAFGSYCNEAVPTIFTMRRIVVRSGDAVGGKFITQPAVESSIAINRTGKVAYIASYTDAPPTAATREFPKTGVFIDDRLVMADVPPESYMGARLMLTDDGQVFMDHEPSPAAPVAAPAPPPANARGLNRIPLRMPRAIPLPIPRNNPRLVAASAASLAMLRSNARGQIAIPVNISYRDFVILLATPARR